MALSYFCVPLVGWPSSSSVGAVGRRPCSTGSSSGSAPTAIGGHAVAAPPRSAPQGGVGRPLAPPGLPGTSPSHEGGGGGGGGGLVAHGAGVVPAPVPVAVVLVAAGGGGGGEGGQLAGLRGLALRLRLPC
eukprot:CAMPEP_0113936664 /NCGR_PEP_ID=MMETSP1339-20121228/3514_1 /TAXON_ID=94617 /ORGANISM="Fibrocapsa japonica" /LENGTH=130 /DNA_ID=CAMNT_0000939197 /DNA_START=290 /DNA_END=679 /DNA_ORIENTATION=+ /assembly_acc=CAM_ASM_000762